MRVTTTAALVALLLLLLLLLGTRARAELSAVQERAVEHVRDDVRGHRLAPIALVSAADDDAAQTFVTLSVTCSAGSVSLASGACEQLTETAFACERYASQRQVAVTTTLREAQLVLAALVYDAPSACAVLPPERDDVLRVHLQPLVASAGADADALATALSHARDAVCAGSSTGFAGLRPDALATYATPAATALERRLVLEPSLPPPALAIMTDDGAAPYVHGACAPLPAMRLALTGSSADARVRLTLRAERGALQLSAVAALKHRVRVSDVTLDPAMAPIVASSVTLEATLSDLHAVLSVTQYCSFPPLARLRPLDSAYFATDTVAIDASAPGVCSAVHKDAARVAASDSLALVITRAVDVGHVALLAGAGGSSHLAVVPANALAQPLAMAFAPGNADDVALELRLAQDDGLLVGVANDPHDSLLALEQDDDDAATFTQTLALATSGSAATDVAVTLRSSHRSWRTGRTATLSLSLATASAVAAQLQTALEVLTDALDTRVTCERAAAGATQCTITYHDALWLAIPTLSVAPSSHASLTPLRASDSAPARSCSAHVEVPHTEAFELSRQQCTLAGDCRTVVTPAIALRTAPSTAAADEQLVANALRALALAGEDAASARAFRVADGVLLTDVPCSLARDLAVASGSASVWLLRLHWRVRASKTRLVAFAQSAVRIYSLAFGARLHSPLTLVLRAGATERDADEAPSVSTTFDVVALPNYETVRLRAPLELVVREPSAGATNLSGVTAAGAWKRPSPPLRTGARPPAEEFRWQIRSRALSLVFDSFRPGLATVVHRQVAPTSLDMRGSILDFDGAMAATALVARSDVLDDRARFRATIEHQRVELATHWSPTTKTQTLVAAPPAGTPSSGSVAGAFALAVELSAGVYSAMDVRISSPFRCVSAPIQRLDDARTVASKVLGMACGASLPADVALVREVQVIRISAVFPALVRDLTGAFTLAYLGTQSLTPIPVTLRDSAAMRLRVLEVLPDARIEVSRTDAASDDGRAFEWRITFGAVGRAADRIRATPTAASQSFTTATAIAQTGLSAADVTLQRLFPHAMLHVRDASPVTRASTLALEFRFANVSSAFPDLALESSALVSTATLSPLAVRLSSSLDELEDALRRSSKSATFRLSVFDRTTAPISLFADAAALDAALRTLAVPDLEALVVQRTQSSSAPRGLLLFDWVVEASHPLVLDIAPSEASAELVSTGVAVVARRVSRGREKLVATDTVSVSIQALDSSDTVAHVDVPVRIERLGLTDLAVRLPLAFVRVEHERSVTIDGIALDGVEIGLTLQIESKRRGGWLALVPKSSGTHAIAPSPAGTSTLTRAGVLSELNAMLESHHLVYTCAPNRSIALDQIEVRLEAATATAIQVLPVEIHIPRAAPSVLLPTAPLVAVEGASVAVPGVKLEDASLGVDRGDGDSLHWRLRADLVRLQVHARVGFVTLSSTRVLPSDDARDVEWQRTLELSGSVEALNAELRHLRYVALASTTTRTEHDAVEFTTFALRDGALVASASAPLASRTFALPVAIRARPPSMELLLNREALRLRTDQDTRASLQNVSIGVVGRSDSTSDDAHLSLSVAAVYGTLALGATAVADVRSAVKTVGPSEVRIVASASRINDALGALQYVPRRSFTGSDELLVRLQHAPDGADGGPPSVRVAVDETVRVVSVFVRPSLDRLPQWEWTASGSNASTLRIATLRSYALPPFAIRDRAGDDPAALLSIDDDLVVRATVSASVGKLLHVSVPTLEALDGSGSSVVLEGRVDDLQATLAQIRYQYVPPPPSRLDRSRSPRAQDEGERGDHSVLITFTDISHLYQRRRRSRESDGAAQLQDTTALETVVATLRLDIDASLRWTIDLLRRDSLTIHEDEERVAIGAALDLSAIRAYDGPIAMTFSAQHGQLHVLATRNSSASAPGAANRTLTIHASDGKRLEKQVAALLYAPPQDFHGEDAVECRVLNQSAALRVHVLPVNDAPSITLAPAVATSSRALDWFAQPAMLLPALELHDPDARDVLDVHIHAVNGSLAWRRSVPRALLDGVTQVGAGTPSLRLKSTLARLNALLGTPQLRFVPHDRRSESTGAVRVCVHDGAAGACDDLRFPVQPFYGIAISELPPRRTVVRGERLELGDAMRITQLVHESAGDATREPLVLQIDTSAGSVLTRAKERDVDCADEYERESPMHIGGVRRTIRALSVACLNDVLAAAVWVSRPMSGDGDSASGSDETATIDLELLNADAESLAVGRLDVRVVQRAAQRSRFIVAPRRANASTRLPPARLWQSDAPRLVDFADVAIESVSRDSSAAELADTAMASEPEELLLELAFNCTRCAFFYATYVPSVSYERAALQGASAMRFIGPRHRLNDVLAMLQVDVVDSAATRRRGEDVVTLTLSPYRVRNDVDALDRASPWSDSAALPIVLEPRVSALEWRVAETQLVLDDEDVASGAASESGGIVVPGIELSGARGPGHDSVADDVALTVSLTCVVGSVRVSYATEEQGGRDQPNATLCAPHEPPVTIATTRKRVNGVLASVRVTPTNASERVDLQFAATVALDESPAHVTAPLVSLHFPVRAPRAELTLVRTRRDGANDSAPLRALEDATVDLRDWVAITASDSGDALVLARVAVRHGRLRVKDSVCCVHVRTALRGRGATILGTAAAVQTALQALEYTGDKDFAGADTLRASIEPGELYAAGGDSGEANPALETLETLVVVAPVNDAPVVTQRRASRLLEDARATAASSLVSLETIEVSDVDVAARASGAQPSPLQLSSTLRVTLSAHTGRFVVDARVLERVDVVSAASSPSSASSADAQALDASSSSPLTRLVFDASVEDTNALFQRTLFDPQTCTAVATESTGITVTVNDLGHNVAAWTPLETTLRIADFGCSARDVEPPQLALAPRPFVTYDALSGTVSIAGLSVVGDDDVAHSSRALPPPLRVTGTCRFEIDLEVQRVAIVAPAQAQSFVVTIWDPNGAAAASVSGTFSVQVDLAFTGIALAPSTAIYADAVAMRTQEVLDGVSTGRGVGESIEAKLALLYAPLRDPYMRFHVDKVAAASLPLTARAQWRISVQNASVMLQAPQIVSQSLVGVATGASVSCVASVVGPPLSGTFRLRLGDESTRALPASASSSDVQDALEALEAVDVVKVSPVGAAAPVWLVTFFSPGERVPLLVGDASGLAPGKQVSDADARVVRVNATSVRVERLSSGKGQGNVLSVVVGATRVDPVYQIVTSAASTLSGTFALGFQDARAPLPLNLLASTDAIVSDALAMQVDEGQLQSAGGRRGASLQSKLVRALAALQARMWHWRDVRVECTRGPPDARLGYEWRVTFLNAPPDFPLLVVAASDALGGANAQVVVTSVQQSNRVGGSFSLQYAQDRSTAAIAADATPDAVEAALNAALAAHASPSSRTRAGRVVVRKARVDGPRPGVSYGVLFLDESSFPSSVSPLPAVRLVANGAQLTGVGAFARVDAVRVRATSGSFALEAANGPQSAWAGDLAAQFAADAFTLDGSASSLDRAIRAIVYAAPVHWHGRVAFEFALERSREDAEALRLSAVATPSVALAFRLPTAAIASATGAFTLDATGGLPRELDDVRIDVVGASATAWFKLQVASSRGQLQARQDVMRSPVLGAASLKQAIWINGTLAHIHAQLQRSVAYVGERSARALDRLTLALFSQDAQLTESVFLVRVRPPPVMPQIHIADSIEAPFTSTHWEDVARRLVFGDALVITGVSIEDANSDPASGVRANASVALDVRAEHGRVAFEGFDDLEVPAPRSESSSRLALTADLDVLNRAVAQLQYRAGDHYREHDTIELTVRNDATDPALTHTRRILVEVRPRELLPRVTLGSLTYTGVEDTGFQFPDLALAFRDDELMESASSTGVSASRQYHQLWSTELVAPTTKFTYPRTRGDDWRHRWVRDFVGPVPSPSASLCALGSVFLFQGSDDGHGRELWVSDGSRVGTHLLVDLAPGPASAAPAEMTVLSGKALFAAAGVDLSWALATDSCNGVRTSSAHSTVRFVVSKSNVWTPNAAYDCPSGHHWATTDEAAQLFPPDEQRTLDAAATNATEPYVFWGSCQWSGYSFGGLQRKHFRFADSRVTGAAKHAGRRDSAPIEVSFAPTEFAGIVCVRDDGSDSARGAGRELWITDGTPRNTQRVLDIEPGPGSSDPTHLTLFTARSVVVFQATTRVFGAELYKSDGTAAGTVLVEDIWRGPRSSMPASFAEWTAGDGRMYFAATTDDGRELWATDAFSSFSAERLAKAPGALFSGTTLVRDVCAGSGSSDPRFLTPSPLGVFFAADDCVHGRELWLSDGSAAGTRLVRDLNPSAGVGSNPSSLALFGGKVYFQAQASLSLGYELYVSDGTSAGTQLLADLAPGAGSAAPSFLSNLLARDKSGAVVSSALYFSAFDAQVGSLNLWRSDGTASGTAPLLDQGFLDQHRLQLQSATDARSRAFAFQNAVYYFMDTPPVAAGLSASQVRSAAAKSSVQYELRVAVSAGQIYSTAMASRTQPPAQNTSVLQVTGTFAELSDVLARLVFVPSSPNWNVETSAGQRSGHVVEWTFTVRRGALVHETYADLLVRPRADAPVIQVPAAVEHPYRSAGDFLSRLRMTCLPIQCAEDTPTPLRGLSIRSADTGARAAANSLTPLRVHLSVSHGTITLRDMACVGRQLLALGARVEFETDVACANAALASASYTSDPHFSGSDTLRIHVVDTASALSDDVAIPLVVAEINDAPYLTSDAEVYDCDEDVPLVLEDFAIVDPDAAATTLTVDVRVAIGSLALLQQPHAPPLPSSLVVTATRRSADDPTTGGVASALRLEGSLRDVNSALARLVYTSARNWNSVDSTFDADAVRTGADGFDAITVTASDAATFNSSFTSVRFVFVRPRADAVAIRRPTNVPTSDHAADDPTTLLRGDEDSVVFVHGLRFASVDDEARITLVVTLTAVHGTLALSSFVGITSLLGEPLGIDSSSSSSRRKRLQFQGTFAAVNRSVRELQYVPDRDFVGQDAIHVTASTLDAYTMERSVETSVVVPVQIDAVNDAPVWDVSAHSAADAVVTVGEPALVRGIQIRDVDVTDAVCPSASRACDMDVTIEVAHGQLTLPRLLEDAANVHVVVQDPDYIVLTGALAHLNAVLDAIVFELDDLDAVQRAFEARNEVGLVLTVDDRGSVGKGGPRVSSTVVYLALAARASALRGLSLTAPTDAALAMQEDAALVFSASQQRPIALYDADIALSRASLLELTVTTPHGAFALARGVSGVQVVANASGALVARGFLQQLNAALNGSAYVPARDWFGSERVAITVVDTTRPLRHALAELSVAVAPVCDEPTWRSTASSAIASVEEDAKLLVDSLALACPDADERDVSVVITAPHGGVMLATYEGLLVLEEDSQRNTAALSDEPSFPSHDDAQDVLRTSRLFFARLVVRGALRDINAALQSMIFAPDRHAHSRGDVVDAITLLASSGCDARSAASYTVRLRIHAVKDAPVLQSTDPFVLLSSAQSRSRIEENDTYERLAQLVPPPALEAIEDADLALEPLVAQDADRVSAVDSGAGLQLRVTVTCFYCRIRPAAPLSQLLERHGLFVSAHLPPATAGDDASVLVAQGSLAALNNAFLSALVFRGASNFHGRALVVIALSDLGAYSEDSGSDSSDDALTSTYATAVRVRPVNDGPEIHTPPYGVREPFVQVREGESVLLRGAPSVDDVRATAALRTPLSAAAAAPRSWSLMLAQPLASDSRTRLAPLERFRGFDALAASSFVRLGDAILFRGRTDDAGDELWRSDGTAAGTALLKDIYPGALGSEPTHLTVFSVDQRAYFAARGPDLSWRVAPDHEDACGGFRQSAFDANVFFAIAASNTWEPDEVYDCPLGYHWMSTAEAQRVFLGTVAEHGHRREPRVYFNECGWQGYDWGGVTRKYLRFSDSWRTGAVKHVGHRDSYRIDTGSFTTSLFAGIVCRRDRKPSQAQQVWGPELWATDGTAGGTRRLKRIHSTAHGSRPSHFAELAGRLYFQATSLDSGAELWVTDGTRAGTLLVADVEPGTRGSEPQVLFAFGDRLVFSARTVRNGRELWISDGAQRTDVTLDRTGVGTSLVLDICAGAGSSEPRSFAILTPPGAGATPLLLFQANDCVHGAELWRSSGTAASTQLVKDISAGAAGSQPSYLTAFAGRVYFQADDGVRGQELWVSDGTSAGTVVLVDLAPGATGSAPSFLSVLAGAGGGASSLVFTAQAERDRQWEFWASDGSASGTRKLFSGSREVASISRDAMDALVAPRFLQVAAAAQSFVYLGQHAPVWQMREAGVATPIVRSLTLVDVDVAQDDGANDAVFRLDVSASKGRVSLGPSVCGDRSDLTFVTGAMRERSREIAVTGRLDALNCAVERVTYHADADASGWDALVVTLTEERSDSSDDDGRLFATTQRVPIEIVSVNDAPVIALPATYTAQLDAWTDVRNIRVSDADAGAGRVFIQLRVHTGRLRVDARAADLALHRDAVFAAEARGAKVLEFAASVRDAEAIWASLAYRCALADGCRDATRDYLTVYVDDNGLAGDGGARDATATATIVVRA